MKIVNVEDYFLPDAGYQINIVPKYLSLFGHDVYIVTSTVEGIDRPLAKFLGTENIQERDEKYTRETGVKIIRVKPFSNKVISGRMIQSRKMMNVVNELNPDVVFVHGNDSLTGVRFIVAKNKKYAMITDSHMLSMASKNKFNNLFYKCYKKFITPIILKNKYTVIRTQNDSFIEKKLGIPIKDSPWISYGSDMLLFHPDLSVRRAFRKEYDINEKDFVVVYTGKLDEAKDGKLLAKTFEKKFNVDRNIILIVVGNTSGEYGKEVDNIFSNSENRIIRIPTQKYVDLAKYYQVADLSVFARQCSLSFYDAQACGLPVLSEDNNINVDRCSHNNGWNFKSGNMKDFRDKIEKIASIDYDRYKEIMDNSYLFVKENYNYETKAREYEEVILKQQKIYQQGKND